MTDSGKQDGEDKELVLMWTSHLEAMLQVMHVLRQYDLFADATLVCGEKQFPVHRFVLSTCSSFLENIFRSIDGEQPMLVLPETSPRAMDKLLDFMYLGQADLSQEELDELLELADQLQVNGLVQPETDNNYQDQSCTQPMKKRAANAHRRPGTAASKDITQWKVPLPSNQSNLKHSRGKKQNPGDKPSPFSGAHHSEGFSSSHLWEAHLDCHRENSSLSCPECPFRTPSALTMNDHLYKHSLERSYICPHCPAKHSEEKLHVAHQRDCHPKEEVIVNRVPIPPLKQCIYQGLKCNTAKKETRTSQKTSRKTDKKTHTKNPRKKSCAVNAEKVTHEKQKKAKRKSVTSEQKLKVKFPSFSSATAFPNLCSAETLKSKAQNKTQKSSKTVPKNLKRTLKTNVSPQVSKLRSFSYSFPGFSSSVTTLVSPTKMMRTYNRCDALKDTRSDAFDKCTDESDTSVPVLNMKQLPLSQDSPISIDSLTKLLKDSYERKETKQENCPSTKQSELLLQTPELNSSSSSTSSFPGFFTSSASETTRLKILKTYQKKSKEQKSRDEAITSPQVSKLRSFSASSSSSDSSILGSCSSSTSFVGFSALDSLVSQSKTKTDDRKRKASFTEEDT